MSEELIKVEEITNVLSTAGNVLQTNQTSVQKCNEAGKTLLDTIESCGEMNDELDAKASEFIAKAKKTVSIINDRRSPLTQLLTRISKEFTSLESAIDVKTATSYAYKLQLRRNEYAAKKIAEQKAREEEQRKIQEKENEKITYKALCKQMILNFYSTWVNNKISTLMNCFNSMNFDNSKQIIHDIKEYLVTGPTIVETRFTTTMVSDFQIQLLSQQEKEVILYTTGTEVMPQQEKEVIQLLSDKKQQYIDLLPSKIKEVNDLHQASLNNAAEADRLQKEKLLREKEEKEKLLREEEERKAIQTNTVEAEVHTAQMNSLFDAAAGAVPTTSVEAKVTKKITVNHPAGILEIFQMWWTSEGVKLPIDELEKAFKKQITFCEKQANKEDIFIKSAYVKYVDDVKAK